MASNAMRQILIERARYRNAIKRGGRWYRVALDEADQIAGPDSDLLAINMAISRLAIHNARLAQVAELCLMRGISTKEAAPMVGRKESTVRRDCQRARERLRKYL
jgi:DNA-directed RNA polymerase specialized sigma24 family protein